MVLIPKSDETEEKNTPWLRCVAASNPYHNLLLSDLEISWLPKQANPLLLIRCPSYAGAGVLLTACFEIQIRTSASTSTYQSYFQGCLSRVEAAISFPAKPDLQMRDVTDSRDGPCLPSFRYSSLQGINRIWLLP